MVQFGIVSSVANPLVIPMLMKAGLLISKVAPERRKHGRAQVAVVGEPGFTRIEGTAIAWGDEDFIIGKLTGMNEDGLAYMPDPNVVLVLPEQLSSESPLAVAVDKMRSTGRRVEVIIANDDGTLLVEFRADGGVLYGPNPSHRHVLAAPFVASKVEPVELEPVVSDDAPKFAKKKAPKKS